MSSFLRIVVEVRETATQIMDKLNLRANAPREGIQALSTLLAGGIVNGINVHVATGVRASQVGTFTGDPTAADTLTINGVAFTARASGAVANEFNIVTGANATALAAAINASTSDKIKNQIVAVATSAQVLTVYALVPGTAGNLFTITESMANFTLVGTTLAGGTEDADLQLNSGLAAEVSA